MDDSQHAQRMNPQSAVGSVDEPGSSLPLPRRPANDATPEAVQGSTPLSPDRVTFLRTMSDRGHFPSQQETERWAQAVFDALRHRALEHDADRSLMTELQGVVKLGEAPEVQQKEMMWGGNWSQRMTELVAFLQTWDRQGFFTKVAQEAGAEPHDPWIEAGICGFFSALKATLGPDADRSVPHLGELQEMWTTA